MWASSPTRCFTGRGACVLRRGEGTRPCVIVSVNGRSYKIMKGVEVEVPAYVAEVLENSRMMADTARRYVDTMAN